MQISLIGMLRSSCVVPDKESIIVMRRRLTIGEREELAAERARRQQELLDEAAVLRGSIAERAQVCTWLAQRDRRRPVRERVGAQLERLSAAQLALDLAARLLQVDDPDRQSISGGEAQPSAHELHAQLNEHLGRWYRMGEGCGKHGSYGDHASRSCAMPKPSARQLK
jgi:hypothetical protein